MSKHKGLCICVVIVILAFGLGVVLRDYLFTPEATLSQYGGTLRLGGLGGKPDIINPILTNQTISAALLELIFNKLVRLNKEMIPEPDLAQSWDISEDGLVYTFYLRKDVRFHDGVECTAEDVKFTHELVTNPETNSPWQSYYDVVRSWEIVDKYTVKVTLKEPNAAYITLMWLPIAPKHLLSGIEPDMLNQVEFNRKPIGTGPFKFTQWTEDNRITLEANPDYYEGRPHLDQIIASGYENTTTYWGAFMRGEIDTIFFLSKEDFETVKRDSDYRTYAFPYIFTYGLEYNLQHPFFRDKKVRQALAYGINIQDIINKVEGGYGSLSTGPFLPGSWPCNPEIKPFEYNPTLALKLLREAGWDLNENGILEKDGQEFRITMLVNTEIRKAQMIALLVYQDLYRIGIRIDIRSFNYKKSGEEQYRRLAQEAGAYLTSFWVRSDPAELVHDWHSKYSPKQIKLYEYKNPEIDQLFDQGQITTKIKQRQNIYHRIHKMIYDDQPVTFLYFHIHLGAIDSQFQNTDSLFSPTMPFYTIKDWSIKEVGSR